MDKIFPALAGAVLGIIVWQSTPYSAEFGIGPLFFIIICAVGGLAVANKL
tara:strand:+ start:522 stop:671 length:150 start_codon:yes stop_codon:yes gene_type:complete